jgi:L-alanine-DL-glutamate epimerase-like enolase superfamily enzyme
VPPTAERLRALLAALPVVIDEATCTAGAADVPSYPDEPRPTSVVTLAGCGAYGRGEHVGWTAAVHARFRDETVPQMPAGAWTVQAWSAAVAARTDDAYERAALEAAAIDLALRQAGTTCAALLGVRPRPVRYVVSFGAEADPLAALAAEPHAECKLDAGGAWSDDVLAALGTSGRVAVVDWKTGGDTAEHARLHRALPSALIEDPGAAAGAWRTAAFAGRVSADGWLERAADLDALPGAPAAVNVKPGRMGGVLEALALAARAEARGIAIYVGGMFVVGPGRSQAQVLAALLSPDGPNDVAPIAVAGRGAPRPTRLAVDDEHPGFGATA